MLLKPMSMNVTEPGEQTEENPASKPSMARIPSWDGDTGAKICIGEFCKERQGQGRQTKFYL